MFGIRFSSFDLGALNSIQSIFLSMQKRPSRMIRLGRLDEMK